MKVNKLFAKNTVAPVDDQVAGQTDEDEEESQNQVSNLHIYLYHLMFKQSNLRTMCQLMLDS